MNMAGYPDWDDNNVLIYKPTCSKVCLWSNGTKINSTQIACKPTCHLYDSVLKDNSYGLNNSETT